MTDYTAVTETWGLPASSEQIAMAYARYALAGDLVEGNRVLELGCGTGLGLDYLKRRGARIVVGADYSLKLLLDARRHVTEAHLVRLDAQTLPFADACFDVVLMLEMAYYLPDLDRALSEVMRVLRRPGRLLVVEPNPQRVDFNPSPLSTWYPNAVELVALLGKYANEVRLLAGFPIDDKSGRDRVFAPLRHFAVRRGLIPRSMRGKAIIKRLLYWRLRRLSGIYPGMTDQTSLVEIDPRTNESNRFANLYALARVG